MAVENYQLEDTKIKNQRDKESTETDVDISSNTAKIQEEYNNIENQINEYQNLINNITNENDKEEIQNDINTVKALLENDEWLTNEILTQINEILQSVKNDYFDIIKIIQPNIEATNKEIEWRSQYLTKGKQINKEDYKVILWEERYNYLSEHNVDIKKFEEAAEEELKNKTEEEKVLIINEISKNSDVRTLCTLSKDLIGPENTWMCTIWERPPLNLCCIKYQTWYILFHQWFSYYWNLPENAITTFILWNIANPTITFNTKTKWNSDTEFETGDWDDIVEKRSKTWKTNLNINNSQIPITVSMYLKAKITEQWTQQWNTAYSNKFWLWMNLWHEYNINDDASIWIWWWVYRNLITQKYRQNNNWNNELWGEKEEWLRELRQKWPEWQIILNQKWPKDLPREYNIQWTLNLNNINSYINTMYRNDSDWKAASLTIWYDGEKASISATIEKNFDENEISFYWEVAQKVTENTHLWAYINRTQWNPAIIWGSVSINF